MAAFEPVLSRNWNVPDSHTLAVYESRGGYKASRKALTEMDPDKVVQLVKDSELRGRGGAGFPTGLKWSFLPKDRQQTFMCVNGDESEPGTFNNRLLIERDPHQFLEGILIACFATKASIAYIYLRFEYIHGFRIMERAIAEAKERGGLTPFGTVEQRQQGAMFNLNTCHIWDEDGEQVAAIRRGDPMEIPVWIVDRFTALGRNIGSWGRD